MGNSQSNTKILLVSDNESDIGNIKLRLEESIKIPCYIWHCLTLSMALDYLDRKKLRADIIILDLGLTDHASPKEIYEKIGISARNIPIIVLTGAGAAEHDLATFVMESGATDHMIRGEFSKLTDTIEFALIRHKIATTNSDQNAYDAELSEIGHAKEMAEAKRNSDKKDREKSQYISWVTGGYSVETDQGKI